MTTLIKKNMHGSTIFGPVLKLDRPGIKKRRFVYRNHFLFFQVKENRSSLRKWIARLGIVDEFYSGLNLIFGRTAKQGDFPGDNPSGLKPECEAFIRRIAEFRYKGIFLRPFAGKLNVLFIFSG